MYIEQFSTAGISTYTCSEFSRRGISQLEARLSLTFTSFASRVTASISLPPRSISDVFLSRLFRIGRLELFHPRIRRCIVRMMTVMRSQPLAVERAISRDMYAHRTWMKIVFMHVSPMAFWTLSP